jgi:hypothetical protein
LESILLFTLSQKTIPTDAYLTKISHPRRVQTLANETVHQETVVAMHTGYYPMAHYLFAMGVGKKKR